MGNFSPCPFCKVSSLTGNREHELISPAGLKVDRCYGLNENGPHNPVDLNTCNQGVALFSRIRRCGLVLGEVYPWG